MAQQIQTETRNKNTATRDPDVFGELRDQVDRLFDNFTGRGSRYFPSLFKDFAGPATNIDVKDNDTHITVEAEVPGMKEDDVTVTLRDGVLTLKGEKKHEHTEEKDNYYMSERSFGSFERNISLPDTIDEDKVDAIVKDGVLTVTLAKKPEAVKPAKQIPIKQK